jgi:hypothetical protein
MEARYLNVDLVIQSDSDLTALATFLEGKVLFLWKELADNQSSIGLETNLCNTTCPEEDILEFLEIIEALPPDLEPLWAESKKKVMDIGFECGSMDTAIDSFINSQIIQRLAKLGCAINIRIYPAVERPRERPKKRSNRGEKQKESDHNMRKGGERQRRG